MPMITFPNPGNPLTGLIDVIRPRLSRPVKVHLNLIPDAPFNPERPWIASHIRLPPLGSLDVGSVLKFTLSSDEEGVHRGLGRLVERVCVERNHVVFLMSVDPQLMFSALYVAIPHSFTRLEYAEQTMLRLCPTEFPPTIPLCRYHDHPTHHPCTLYIPPPPIHFPLRVYQPSDYHDIVFLDHD